MTGARAPAGGPAGLRAQVVVLAKEPLPGRAKTRLTPPFSPAQAARIAAAALADTLEAAFHVPAVRHVVALDGAPDGWVPDGWDVVAQRGAGLDERIAAAVTQAYARLPVPVVLIGMDTPQVTPELLESAIRPLAAGTADAAFGPADDGGFWLLGLRRPDPQLVLGVPMSTAHTGAAQLARLLAAGLRIRQLPRRLDVDTAADAAAVARQIPHSRLAATLQAMEQQPACSRANFISGSDWAGGDQPNPNHSWIPSPDLTTLLPAGSPAAAGPAFWLASRS